MSETRIKKLIVCSECGRPLRTIAATTASIQRDSVENEEEVGEDVILSDGGTSIETIIERGPVCGRCAAYR